MALHRVRLDVCERLTQVVGRAGVEVGATSGGVLADEHGVGQKHTATGRRHALEGDVGVEVTLVVAVEIDLEDASHVGFVVGMVVEGDIVNLDGPIVPRWVLRVGGVRQH
jgi:hypothetical protein